MDLHLHTVYSDGCIKNLDFLPPNEIMSITDHNTIRAFQKDSIFYRKLENFIIGTELTIVGLPDYLIYFPEAEANSYVPTIEDRLLTIRQREEAVIELAYYEAGFKDWETDKAWSSSKDFVPEMRTAHLAAILYKYRKGGAVECSGCFEGEDIVRARQYRRSVASYIVNPNEPFDIAEDLGGA